MELNGFALIPGHTMKALMKNFGAKLEDMDLIESAHIHERLPQDLQPVMKHRRNAFHRVLIDQGMQQSYQIQTVLKYFAFFKIRKNKNIFPSSQLGKRGGRVD